jgi:hypothetical protein
MNLDALEQETTNLANEELWNALQERKFSSANPPEKPIPLLKLCDSVICTPGNLSVVSGQAKSAKSAALGGAVASLLDQNAVVTDFNAGGDDRDTLGFTSEPGEGAIVWIDTEQSRYDLHTNVLRVFRRAAVSHEPPYFHVFSLVDISTNQRREALGLCLERLGPIRAIFLDGVADLLLDPNDAEEAFALVDHLHMTAVRYNCAIISVLHENPGGGETGKTRGHLGSQLERKAESNIRVNKDKDGVSTIFVEKGRHCYIPQTHGHCFAWDDEAGMHKSLGQRNRVMAERKDERKAAKSEEEITKLTEIVVRLLKRPSTKKEIAALIENDTGLSQATAFRKVAALIADGVLVSSKGNMYVLSAMDEPLDGE